MNGEGEKLTEKSISVSSRTISYATQASSTTTLSGWVLEFRSIQGVTQKDEMQGFFWPLRFPQ